MPWKRAEQIVTPVRLKHSLVGSVHPRQQRDGLRWRARDLYGRDFATYDTEAEALEQSARARAAQRQDLREDG